MLRSFPLAIELTPEFPSFPPSEISSYFYRFFFDFVFFLMNISVLFLDDLKVPAICSVSLFISFIVCVLAVPCLFRNRVTG